MFDTSTVRSGASLSLHDSKQNTMARRRGTATCQDLFDNVLMLRERKGERMPDVSGKRKMADCKNHIFTRSFAPG